MEASTENQELIDAARPALISFLAFDKDRVPRIAGSGFLIAASPDLGIVLTAKHVLTEGVSAAQKPHSMTAGSALFVPAGRNAPSLDPRKLRAIWMDSSTSEALNVTHANYNDILDIACCVVHPQTEGPHSFSPREIPLDTTIPQVGDFIHMFSLGGQNVDEVTPPQATDGRGHEIKISRRVALRAGTVTGVYPEGYRQYKWPCFTTSIPAEPGMSGGFVSLFRPNQTVSACGVVCADNSEEESRLDFHKSGESVVALTWIALALRLPASVPAMPGAPTFSLHHMMSTGNIRPAIGGIDHIEVSQLNDDACTIRLRPNQPLHPDALTRAGERRR